ncbi:MAG TPA: conjugal transfer protein TraX [Oribacterium sp.]|nr:conjugal transfer protein TraX [Oribacterium sp.]
MASYQSVLRGSKKTFGISGGLLKLFALLMMTLDHFAVIIIHNGKLYGFIQEYYDMAVATPEGQWWLKLYEVFRIFGRLSFPVFAFLLVEGFLHTQNFWKYFSRVLFFALLSEVPYDIALYNEIYNFQKQNTLFTLATGLLVMYCMKRCRKHPELKWLSVIAGMAVAEFGRLDYGALAVLMIALMYNFHKEKTLMIASGVIISIIDSLDLYGFAALSFLLIWFYNGERGRFHFKWLSYIYYPLHLILFFVMIYIGAQLT